MKYGKRNHIRAIAAICAMVILLSATGLTAFADNTEANQADTQQSTRMGRQGRKMHGGRRQGGESMPFDSQDGEFTPPTDGKQRFERPGCIFAPPADGEQLPELPDGEFAPPVDGEEPPEKPDGDFAPPADGEEPPEKPEGDFAPPADGEQPPEIPEGDAAPDQADQNNPTFRGPNGRMRRQFSQPADSGDAT